MYREGVGICDLNLRFYFSVLSLASVSMEKIYQVHNTVFEHISKHLFIKNAPRHVVFSTLFLVCGAMWSNTVFRV